MVRGAKSAAGLPDAGQALTRLAEEAAGCERCALYRHATQAVFGEGPDDAAIMLVGEQPGDQEDKAGRPFVGPAGRILERAVTEAGLDKAGVYLTNAVKHFKHEMRGKRRMHQRPNQGEVEACRWWLDHELAVVRPSVVVGLGVTAARVLLGRPVVLARDGGRPLRLAEGRQGLMTLHPAAILRVPDEEARRQAYLRLVGDLRRAAALAGLEATEAGR